MSTKMEALAKAMTAAIGDPDEELEVSGYIDMGYPKLNEILSGDKNKGLPQGRIVEIYGPPSSGKTLLATQAMIAAQRAGGVAGLSDHELTFQVPFAKKFGLIDTFPQFTYKRPLTWEASNTLALKACEAIRNSKILAPDAPIVWVFDSVAAMIPQSMLTDSKGKKRELDELNMNDTTALSRVTSTTLKVINRFSGDLNATFIYLNQTRTKPGVIYGDPTTTPGGSAMEFYASIRIAVGRKMLREEVDGEKETVGQIIGLTTKKNKIVRPFQETDMRMMFDADGMAHWDFTTMAIDDLIAAGKLKTPRAGWVEFGGKQWSKKQLAAQIDSDGKQADLLALLKS
jgi:recombination protein RecA